MLLMVSWVVRIYKNVVEVDGDRYIKEVTKNVIHEPLESRRRIGKSERHD